MKTNKTSPLQPRHAFCFAYGHVPVVAAALNGYHKEPKKHGTRKFQAAFSQLNQAQKGLRCCISYFIFFFGSVITSDITGGVPGVPHDAHVALTPAPHCSSFTYPVAYKRRIVSSDLSSLLQPQNDQFPRIYRRFRRGHARPLNRRERLERHPSPPASHAWRTWSLRWPLVGVNALCSYRVCSWVCTSSVPLILPLSG